MITYNVRQVADDVHVTLMSIYDKSEIDDVSDAYLSQLISEIEGKEINQR